MRTALLMKRGGFSCGSSPEWSCNAADWPTQMIYPSGETVDYGHLAGGALKTVTGDTLYVSSSTYDALGRITERELGAGTLTINYQYWDFTTPNGVGRLKEIAVTNATSTLQDLWYGDTSTGSPGYDEAGNVMRIENLLDSEVQTFTYDNLNRLISAQATGAYGYNESYSYDFAGRMATKTGLGTYSYPDVGQLPFHGVTGTDDGAGGVNVYGYDANGNMVTRNIAGEANRTLTYDAENRLIDVDQLSLSGDPDVYHFAYDGNGRRVKAVDDQTGDVTYYPAVGFEVTVENTTPLDPYCSAPALSIPNGSSSGVSDTITISGTSGAISELTIDLSVTHGRVGELIATLKHADTGTTIMLMDQPGYPPRSGLCKGANIDGTFDDDAGITAEGGCSSGTPALSGTFQPDGSLSDYDLESLNGDWTITVSDNVAGSYTGTLASWCVNATGPTADSGERGPVASETAGKAGVMAALFPGRPFANLLFTAAEWLAMRLMSYGGALDAARHAVRAIQESLLVPGSPTSGEVWRSYHYAGGQRVAVRVQGGTAVSDDTFYIMSDHLGSTTVTADSSGNVYSELRFKPWGEIRFDSASGGGNETPTDFGFTGQRVNSYINLIHMGTRWYDPTIGRFTAADSIIPGVGNPIAFDRYQYAFNNSIRYNDPSGHISCEFQYAVQGDCDPEAPPPSNNTPYEPPLDQGGENMSALFDAFKDAYPDATIDDFMIWILSGEFSGFEEANGDYPDLAEILAHGATHWLLINEGNMTNKAILNWLWAMESGRRRYENWRLDGVISGYGSGFDLAKEVVWLMRNSPDDEWLRREGNEWDGEWDPVNLPPHGFTWGNKYMYPGLTISEFEALITANGHEDIIFKWGEGGATFYVLSIWQSNEVCEYNIYYSPCQ